MQAGEARNPIKVVVSTLAEIEHLLPVLDEFKQQGRKFNILYGIPFPLSQVTRLAGIGRILGKDALSVLVDHAAQLDHVSRFFDETKFPVGVYLKVDTGYHRAGLPPKGLNKDNLISRVMALEAEGRAQFIGLYSHSSLSYNDTTPHKAMENLEGEINGCLDALNENKNLFSSKKEITISVGASPQVTAIENLLEMNGGLSASAKALRKAMQKATTRGSDGFQASLELHAGVYSILDIQQLSTNSRAEFGDYEDEIAISVITEVCSVYNNGERQTPEALVSVGVLGLGREPCIAYKGWGVVDRSVSSLGSQTSNRLIVGRISQEHSIIVWDESTPNTSNGEMPPIPMQVGQSIRIFPNHACITGTLYGWYLVTDSDSSDADKIVDVWVRASGW